MYCCSLFYILVINLSLSSLPSMYKPPYPAQNFHFVPAFPSQDPQRPVVPAPLPPPPGSELQQAPCRAPAYGLITDLPLPVPMADSQVAARLPLFIKPRPLSLSSTLIHTR